MRRPVHGVLTPSHEKTCSGCPDPVMRRYTHSILTHSPVPSPSDFQKCTLEPSLTNYHCYFDVCLKNPSDKDYLLGLIILIILALRKLRQKNYKFKSILGWINPFSKNNKFNFLCAMALNLSNAVILEHSPSCSGGPNHKIILVATT